MPVRLKITILLIIAFSAFSFYVSYALSVDNSITTEDKQAIRSLKLESKCTNVFSIYEKEIECLLAIQRAVQNIGELKCPTKSAVIEPPEFLKRNFGCCYDRARFIEKASRYFGFETRHLFIIEPYRSWSVSNFLPLGQESHATSEIYTSKGWLGIDSNDPFILLSESGLPSTYRNAIENLNSFPMMPKSKFYASELDIIYGLYSRHGNFHGKNFPGPEYVYKELQWNWR